MTPNPDQDPDRQFRHLFTNWLLGPKRFIIVVIGFFLILIAETGWTWQELAAKAGCGGLTQDPLCWAPLFPRAVVQGFVTASFCLVSLWFINYAIPEVRKMIAEMFKQQRYEAGLRRGLAQAIAQQKAWEGWNRRRETAQANGLPFTEPPPTLDATPNGHHG